jgi:hypothetical protein
MPLFSSNTDAAKQMGELGAAVYLNKALGGTGSRKALQKIVNSNAELKKTINSTPGWERAVKAAKNILNAEKKQVEEAQNKRKLPLGNVNPPTNNLTNAQKKKMANGPPVIYEKDPSAPKAVANSASTRDTEQLGSVSGGGKYKTRRSHKKTKKSRKTRGRRH